VNQDRVPIIERCEGCEYFDTNRDFCIAAKYEMSPIAAACRGFRKRKKPLEKLVERLNSEKF